MNEKDRAWAEGKENVPEGPRTEASAPREMLAESSAPDPKERISPPPKRDIPEKTAQESFANWCIDQRDKHGVPFSWHATHKPSRATPGTPDFWVLGMWIEFKKDYSCELSPPQELFRRNCEAWHIAMHVVYSAEEAIALVEEEMKKHALFDDLFNLI